MDKEVFFHGTSDKHLESIFTGGLKKPFLTIDKDIARYFADEEVSEKGGYPVVLEVEVPLDHLEIDQPSIDEPIDISKEEVQKALNDIAKKQPEWYSRSIDTVNIPRKRYDLSLDIVGSCRCNTTISPENIKVSE